MTLKQNLEIKLRDAKQNLEEAANEYQPDSNRFALLLRTVQDLVDGLEEVHCWMELHDQREN